MTPESNNKGQTLLAIHYDKDARGALWFPTEQAPFREVLPCASLQWSREAPTPVSALWARPEERMA